MPWDTVYIVFNFTPKENYNLFRLNRTFTKLIEKRRLGLTFSKPDITPSIFFELLKKSQQTLKFLKISANLKYIKPREFDDRMIKPRQLIHLDLVCFNGIRDRGCQPKYPNLVWQWMLETEFHGQLAIGMIFQNMMYLVEDHSFI